MTYLSDREFYQKGFPLTWDNTMRVSFSECPRKWYWFMRGLDYSFTPIYFTWGRAWHAIMLTWHSFKQPDDPMSSEYDEQKLLALQAGFDVWDSETDGPGDGINSRARLQQVFEGYLEVFPYDPFRIIELGGEAGWTYPIHHPESGEPTKYMNAGSLDGIIDWPGYGILVLENKSTSVYLADNYIQQWDFSPQVKNYNWYYKMISGESNGTLVNMVTKNVPGPRSNWSTERATRTIIKHSANELAQHEAKIYYDIMRAKFHWKRWFWPLTDNPINCVGGIGKSPCLFKDLCRIPGDYRDIDLSIYKNISPRKGDWTPWARQGDV